MADTLNPIPDLGQLISLVHQNEILWNKTMADHNNNKWKNAAWKKIGQEWYGGASIVESGIISISGNFQGVRLGFRAVFSKIQIKKFF